jgi:hypothetical protein
LAHSGHTSRSLSYAMPCTAQRTIRTSAPLAGWVGSGPVTGGCDGMDRAPSPSIVTPLSVDPHWPTHLRLPVPRDPGVTLRRDGPVPRHPDVRSCGVLPCVGPRDLNVGRTGLGRHRLCWRRGWLRGCLNGRGPHVTAPQDQERHQKRCENAPTPHIPLQSPLALACAAGSRFSMAEAFALRRTATCSSKRGARHMPDRPQLSSCRGKGKRRMRRHRVVRTPLWPVRRVLD